MLDLDAAELSRFGDGDGPRVTDGVLHLLDDAGTFSQSNAAALPGGVGAFESTVISGRLRVEEGGDGGALLLLSADAYGARGPAPFVPDWTAPDLRGSLAVGIDVHDPENDEPFGEWGNVLGLPEREVSLHFDGREIVKRLSPEEFRGDWAEFEIRVEHVCGGAEVSVRIGDGQVYDHYFVANARPYPSRVAVGAGTRADVATRFDLRDVRVTRGAAALPRRRPLHVDVFHHVLTDNSKTSFETEVELPPLSWAFGRVLLTLDIHDAGRDWDEWDRNGHLYVSDDDGVLRDIVPFITSYRRACHWVVDVTPFRPWLTGRRRLKIEAGTTFYKNRGYMMSVSLDFHHALPGAAPRPEPFQVVPLWTGVAHYGSDENHFADFFSPVEVAIPEGTEDARIRTTTTGHSQVGEFTPSARAIIVAPDVAAGASSGAAPEEPARFENVLWKTDCYLNPVRPQFGTWKYPRAGWAPGDVVRPWWIDLGGTLRPGRTARFTYEPQPYDLSDVPEDQRPDAKQLAQASHVIRSYLVLYRTPADAVPAPVLRVTNVAGGSAAAKAGIRQGDYIASYDGTRVDSIEDLTAAKKVATEAGRERVAVVLFRGSERIEVEMTSGQMGVNLSTN